MGLGSTIAVSAIITVNALRLFLFILPIRGFSPASSECVTAGQVSHWENVSIRKSRV